MLTKVFSLIEKLKARSKHKKFIEKKKERTQLLRKSKASDMARWSKSTVLHNNWNERSFKLADFIKDGSRVVEFGAGDAILGEYLQNIVSYQPVDIIKREEHFLVCDLNSTPLQISMSNYDVVIFSGVLEYVYDIDTIFQILSININQIVMSYSCSDISSQDRFENGWLSDYKLQELKSIFRKHKYKVMDEVLWKDQTLFNLMRTS